MYLGVDIGSASSKAVVIDEEKNIVSQFVISQGTGTEGPRKAVENALNIANVQIGEIRYSVATGYGRLTFQAEKQITEITCHAKGVHFLVPEVRTIIDIGGQDAKVIRINEKGNVMNFVMNEKCAAGTGRFLEVMARVLGCELDELAVLASKATEKVSISSTCAVFAESEVISQLAAGCSREDVAAGVHQSIAKRIAGLANRIGIEEKIGMSGGVAKNIGAVRAIQEALNTEMIVVENPQIAGALGAALLALEQKRMIEKTFKNNE